MSLFVIDTPDITERIQLPKTQQTFWSVNEVGYLLPVEIELLDARTDLTGDADAESRHVGGLVVHLSKVPRQHLLQHFLHALHVERPPRIQTVRVHVAGDLEQPHFIHSVVFDSAFLYRPAGGCGSVATTPAGATLTPADVFHIFFR